MGSLTIARYTLDVTALRKYLLSKGIMERSTKWNKLWFRHINNFKRGV